MPAEDVESAPFWSACRAHRLEMQQCSICRHYQYPPTTFCERCRSTALNWHEVSGFGKLFSWIVVRYGIPREIFGDLVPYAVGLVQLNEGPRIVTNIVECNVESIFDGMPLEVIFDDVDDGITLPKFRPLKSGPKRPDLRPRSAENV